MTLRDTEYYHKFYEVDESIYTEDIESHFQRINPAVIYFFDGVNSDSGLKPDLPKFPMVVQLQSR